ncbi:DNA polymerase III subunit gamma/tau [Desulfobacca acetoxidans]
MSYQVLARKWRPQNFDEVVGQEHITRTLKNALESGRVAHAFLFSGPRGVGKTSVARILAKALNCAEGPTPTPCNRCQSCVEITQGHSLDVLEIDGASNRGIDEVRELRENIKYLPAHGSYKVFIIDEVHMLTKEAFNALLKTLEEPPPHAIFVMATTESHKVPVTILSRCQRYDFKRLSTAAIQAHLANLTAQEGWHLAPEGLLLIAQEAEGGMRDAQGLLDQVITFGGPEVSPPEIARILGVTDRLLLLQTLEAILNRQAAQLLDILAELHEHGHDLRRFFHDLLFFSRHLVIAALGPEVRRLADLADPEWDRLQEMARQTNLAHLFNLLTTLLKGEEELRRSPLPRLSLEILLLRLVSLEPLLDLPEWLTRLSALEMKLDQGHIPARGTDAPQRSVSQGKSVDRSSQTSKAPSVAEPSKGDSPASWESFLHFVTQRGGIPLGGKLHNSHLHKQRDGRLHVTPGPAWRTAQPEHLEQIQALARDFFGPQCQLVIEAAAAAKSSRETLASRRQLSLDEIKQLAEGIFGGTWLTETIPTDVAKENKK